MWLAALKRIATLFLVTVISTLVIFMLVEGVCSSVFVLRLLHRPIAERVHTQYDPLLGWVNIPNVFIPDMYGDGVYLRTNAQGFRNDVDFPAHVADDTIRIVCSGDSFTLGYGVDNDHTWCQLLTAIDPGLETVNMGQGAYGIDQAYLWYLRDGITLDHQIHILAFNNFDVDRFRSTFLGYDKPFFAIRDNVLTLCNTPVPERPFYMPWLIENAWVIDQLRSVRVLKGMWDMQTRECGGPPVFDARREEVDIFLRIVDELGRHERARQCTRVIVYLPTQADLVFVRDPFSQLRTTLKTEFSRRGVPFIDLVDDFNTLSGEELSSLFLGDVANYPLSAGHYSVKGNRYVAEMLYKRLSPYLERMTTVEK